MGKDTQKSNSVRRIFSSGGVVYKKDGDNTLWLIRKTNANNKYPNAHWMFPKGWIDNEFKDVPGPIASGKIKATTKDLEEAAIREVREETGVEAVVIQKITTTFYKYPDPDLGTVIKFVTFHLMQWKKDLPEGFDKETAEVRWLPYEEAYKMLSFSQEKQILKKAKEML